MLNVIIHDGFDKMDFEKITSMLTKAYWSSGIKLAEVKKGASHSALVVGAFLDNKTQIAYARVISDQTRFAYILDVYVDEKYRKKDVGHKMINYILSNPSLKDVYQWLLITKDAHGVYGKCGFKPLCYPENWMEIRRIGPQQ